MACSVKTAELFNSYCRIRDNILEMEEHIIYDSRRCGDLEANGKFLHHIITCIISS
jgi:hypothetical protein